MAITWFSCQTAGEQLKAEGEAVELRKPAKEDAKRRKHVRRASPLGSSASVKRRKKAGSSVASPSPNAWHPHTAINANTKEQESRTSSVSSLASTFLVAPLAAMWTRVVWPLLYHYFLIPVVGSVMMFVLTLLSTVLRVFVAKKDSHPSWRIHGFPTVVDESLKTAKKWRAVTPKTYDALDPHFAEIFTKETLADFVNRSEPVIVKNLGHANAPKHLKVDFEGGFAPLQRKSRDEHGETKSTKLFIELNLWPFCKLGKSLNDFIWDYCGRRQVIYTARFAGGYTAGLGHIDSFPSYNFYYVARGAKQVYLVPRQFNPSALGIDFGAEGNEGKLSFQSGVDNVHITGDTADDKSLGDFLSKVPGAYDFKVEAGDVLLFNNSATMHKFINLTADAEIWTIRLQNFTGASPLVLRNDCFNWKGAKLFASMLLGGGAVRDTTYA